MGRYGQRRRHPPRRRRRSSRSWTAIGIGHRTDPRRHCRRLCGTRSAGAGNAGDGYSNDNAAAPPLASPPEPLTVVLSMSRPCWVAALVDGQRTIYRVLQSGETATLAGKSAIAIRLGDAGAVTWTINGRDPGTPGANGAVRDVRIDLENATTVR